MDTALSIATQIYDYACQHYNDGGWDVIVEAWGKDYLAEVIEREGYSRAEAWDFFGGLASVWADRQADAVNSAF